MKIESSLSGNHLDWLFTNCLVRLLLMDCRNKSQWLAACYGHDTSNSVVSRLSPGGLQSDWITKECLIIGIRFVWKSRLIASL